DYVGVQAAVDAGRAPEPVALLPEIGTLLAHRAQDRGAVNLPLPEQDVEADGPGWRLVLRAPLPVEEQNAQISLLTGMAGARIMRDGGVGRAGGACGGGARRRSASSVRQRPRWASPGRATRPSARWWPTLIPERRAA